MASSSSNLNPTVDPNTNHMSVTVDTPPEQWLRGMYKASTIRDVLIKHLNDLCTSQSGLQQRAMNRLADLMRTDVGPWMDDTVIDWVADIGQIANDLDVLFFRGLINRDAQTYYIPEPGGLPAGPVPGSTLLGYTCWDGPGSMELNIRFDTRDNGPLRRLTRIQRRSRVLGILCHEMIHAFFFLYSCRSPDCCMEPGGDFDILVAGDGHGPAWQSIATYINLILTTLFPILEYPDTGGYMYAPGTDGTPGAARPDALYITESLGNRAILAQQQNQQQGQQPNQPPNQP